MGRKNFYRLADSVCLKNHVRCETLSFFCDKQYVNSSFPLPDLECNKPKLILQNIKKMAQREGHWLFFYSNKTPVGKGLKSHQQTH